MGNVTMVGVVEVTVRQMRYIGVALDYVETSARTRLLVTTAEPATLVESKPLTLR